MVFVNKCPQCRDILKLVSEGVDSKWVCLNCGREFRKGRFEKQILTTVMPIVKKKRVSKRKTDDNAGRKKFLWWEYLAAFLGIPIEMEDKKTPKTPAWACVTTAIVVMAVSFFALPKPFLLEEWGLVPSNFLQKGGVTFLTEFFFHVDTWHVLGNIYFLLVFGEGVEHEIGHIRFLLLLFASTVFGNFIHLLVDYGSDLPLVGASGGVAGVMLFYALQFPKKQLGIIFLFQWVRVPAQLYVAFWLIYQVMGAMDQIQHVSPVSYIAHLGGCLVGYILWRAWKKIPENTIQMKGVI